MEACQQLANVLFEVGAAAQVGDWPTVWELYVSNSWLHYGVCITWVPLVIATFFGFFLELVAAMPWGRHYHIAYSKSEGTRAEGLAKTRALISWPRQVLGTLNTFFGPVSVGAVIAFYYIVMWATADLPAWDGSLPTAKEFLTQFILCMFIADFGLYWGHRLQHDIKFLWDKFHWDHHQLKWPSAFSTAYIDQTDATLQSIIPMAICVIIVKTHPVTLMAYHTFHYCNNMLNHSGLDAWWLNILTLKILPLRSSNAFHDYHHHFSSRGENSKNFAEMFWIWDWLFGTYCDVSKLTTHDRHVQYHSQMLFMPKIFRAA